MKNFLKMGITKEGGFLFYDEKKKGTWNTKSFVFILFYCLASFWIGRSCLSAVSENESSGYNKGSEL